MKKTLENIKIQLLNNILEYCYCWSGKKYNNCCKNQDSDFINFFSDFMFSIEEKDKKPRNQEFCRKLWSHMTKDKCIIPWCSGKSIESHIYPKGYLKRNGTDFFVSFHKKTIHANNLSTPLFCDLHDKNLFQLSDNIDNFHDLLKNQKALENYFEKLLFFKYKTFILQIRYLLLGIFYWCKESERSFFEIYPLYNQICNLIEDNNQWKRILHIFPSMNYNLNNPYHTIFSNICFTSEKNPFWILSTKDAWWYTISLCAYGDVNNNIISILNEFKKIRENKTDENDLQIFQEVLIFLKRSFNLEVSDNRVLFLYRDFIDIWLTNFDIMKQKWIFLMKKFKTI